MSHVAGSTAARRRFLQQSAGAVLAAFSVPYTWTARAEEATRPRAANDRWRVGAIGMRYQGTVIAKEAMAFGDVVAVCDVDRQIGEKARQELRAEQFYTDYRKLLDRPDIDLITIGTPDHWHAKMLVDACRAGKDVYCEKPLTLTVDEGKQIRRAIGQTQAVVQVGTWQRSDHRFRLAVEMVRQGRIGTLRKVTVVLGKNETGGPFKPLDPPPHLDWNQWQGQTPDVPYIAERCHYTFRWWHEYSGGQMTDWGAHHVDIAQWAIGREHSGPVEVEGTARLPDVANGYNVPIDFQARYVYDNGVVVELHDRGRNGVLFEGDAGRIFVNRGTVAGKPVDDLQRRPLDRGDFALYPHDNLGRPARMGKIDSIQNHMGNLYDCMQTRSQPIADVESQHRSATTCHLGNIAMQLGRKLRWDPDAETCPDDPEANALLSREQRKGFELGPG